MRTSKFAAALNKAFDEFAWRRQISLDDEKEAISAIGRLSEYQQHESNFGQCIDMLLSGAQPDKESIMDMDESFGEIRDILKAAEYRHGFMDALHLVRFFIEEDDARSAALFCPRTDGTTKHIGYNDIRGGKYND